MLVSLYLFSGRANFSFDILILRRYNIRERRSEPLTSQLRLSERCTKRVESMRVSLYVGLAIVIVSEILLAIGIGWVGIFFTPIVWTGYILLMDGIVFRIRGESWIHTRRKRFLAMILLSAGFWYVFEFFNLFLKNWKYEGLPVPWITAIGMTWAFATIGPAMMETTDFVKALGILKARKCSLRLKKGVLYACMVLGVLFLTSIVLVPPAIAKYLAIPLWMSFILLLEPINYLQGRESILHDLEKGSCGTLLSLLIAGLICGFLWELFNYWAYARWTYEIPYASSPKVFEMPLLGYLGFPLLAVEYYAFYSVTLNWRR